MPRLGFRECLGLKSKKEAPGSPSNRPSSVSAAPKAPAPRLADAVAEASSDAPLSTAAPPVPSASGSGLNSLWIQAYQELRDSDSKLVDDYEKLLSLELHPTGDEPAPGGGSLDNIENKIDGDDARHRQKQLTAIAHRGLQQMEDAKAKCTIFGRELVLRDKVAQGTHTLLKMMDFISEAVKVSPEASLVWAGVCVVLPILTNPSAADEANSSGFTYVTSRMRFYSGLEQLLWRANLKLAPELKMELEASVVALYRQILNFQLGSVVRFYRTWPGRLGRDIIQHDDWQGKLASIKQLESSLGDDFRKVNDSASRIELERLADDADKICESMTSLLAISEKHFQVSEESRDYLRDIAENSQNVSQLLLQSGDHDEVPLDLPTVEDARYDSADVQEQPKCLQGTRSSVRDRILTWADDRTADHIFWLTGPAGVGKPTLTRTLADTFDAQGKLAAGYFFKRGQQDRNGMTRLFSTLASQMAEMIPLYRPLLRKSLNGVSRGVLEKKSLEKQFNMLILQPLKGLQLDGSSNISQIIIIDALDECEQLGKLLNVLSLFSRLHELHPLRLCVLFTSRITPTVENSFKDLKRSKVSYQSLDLHNEYPEEAKADISTYLTTTFDHIKSNERINRGPWPDAADMSLIIEWATTPSPLFIYASTLCLFVKDSRKGKTPRKQLEYWLRQSDRRAPHIIQIYLPILQEAFGLNPDDESVGAFEDELLDAHQILIAVVFAYTPLPAAALARLLDLDEDTAINWLQDLQAVLHLPLDPSAPVQLLHKSFRDFFQESDATALGSFHVEFKEAHAMMASRCIWRMSNNGLRQDICNIKQPGKEIHDIDKDTVANCVPPDLRYACLYWAYHLSLSRRSIDDVANVDVFLRTHLLHWLEVLSLLGMVSEAMVTMNKLIAMCQSSTSSEPSTLLSLIEEARDFVFSFSSTISLVSLQVYGGALTFCPTNELKHTYWSQCLPFISDVRGVGRHFGYMAAFIETTNYYIHDMAFSPCGKFFVTIGDGFGDIVGEDITPKAYIVQQWRTDTGALIHDLTCHTEQVTGVAFSHDGHVVACGRDGTVWIWDAVTGILKQTLCEEGTGATMSSSGILGQTLCGESTSSAMPSSDDAAKDHSIYITMLGVRQQVAVSPNSTFVASVSRDVLRLWNIRNGSSRKLLEGDGMSPGTALSFSPDSTMLAALMELGTIRVWDATAGILLHTISSLEGYAHILAPELQN